MVTVSATAFEPSGTDEKFKAMLKTLDGNPDLTGCQRADLFAVFRKYGGLFPTKEMPHGNIRTLFHHIDIGDNKPFKQTPRLFDWTS